ncbi:MAG: (5-formylfuran-3-yl)methyl phosphate synthase [Thiohalobacteraceae bacterium]
MTGLLASVSDTREALLALAGGADIIDLKDPARGALGAVPAEIQRQVVQLIGGRRPVSATVGDLPMNPACLTAAVLRTAATGVDLVKIGLYDLPAGMDCVTTLGQTCAQQVPLIAVLFADQQPDLDWLPDLAAAGFHGVMLDTADKAAGRLLQHASIETLQAFVQRAHGLGLLTGLAGSLRIEDIPTLLPLAADYLGFRGALCVGRRRTGSLSMAAIAAARSRISQREQPVDTVLRDTVPGCC